MKSSEITSDPVINPPAVVPIRVAPGWAGDRGEQLLRLTQEQMQMGRDSPQFRDVDPLTEFNEWFGRGARTKNACEPSLDRFVSKRLRVFRASWGVRRLSIDPAAAAAAPVTISYTLDGENTRTVDVGAFDHSLLRTVLPMRDFARRLKQFNKPVAPWLHTVGHHVGAESHHERTLMMLADYHPGIDYIAGQPFTLVWSSEGSVRSHTPDVVLLGGGTLPYVVDVKSLADAASEKWLERVPIVRQAVEALGMGYLVWTGMSRPYRRNLENFTEARVPASSYTLWSQVALDLCAGPTAVSDLADDLDANGYGRLRALTLIRRMLWCQELRTNMFAPYTRSSVVERNDG